MNLQTKIRLLCFPYSGASAAIYYPWINLISGVVEVCPMQLPGRGSRLSEPLLTRLQPLVEEFGKVLHPPQDRPFAFFGHSLGALLSFELARYLREKYGLSPVHLFVSGHAAPHYFDSKPALYALPDLEFIQALRKLNGTPPEVLENQELLELILPILRADFEVSETYGFRPGEPLDCPITVFGGLQDADVPRESLEAWRIHTRSSFTVRMFPGDHFFIHTARQDLLRIVAQDLFRTMRKFEE